MIILIMGVAGSGKTTIGKMLADSVGWRFLDADEFHPPANIEKMRSGVPLNDEDRRTWLNQLQAIIRDWLDRDEPAVLACSALKQSYRDLLLLDGRARLVYLKGKYELIEERLRHRNDHYMNPTLLDSQFATLEEPEDALRIDINSDPHRIVDTIRKHLKI